MTYDTFNVHRLCEIVWVDIYYIVDYLEFIFTNVTLARNIGCILGNSCWSDVV